ncbi:LuxR C-terminal-related transcriptional regulator [Mycobacterium sp. NPDC051804]|uniref:helix-turn-helix transcriptional regulator n=1 Tax=Mycobacterium sp. NPDC051804 TaxID=3364295 RepID=UPI00378D5C58
MTEMRDVGVSGLPTGTVTLLLADIEGSTRLWDNHSDEMRAAVARLDRTLAEVVVAHRGVRPVEQGEGDSFVIAFARASDAVACAVAVQRAPLAPIRLRIGLHTGEVQLRDEGNYIGPTINRTARLRDLAHGGQTLVTSTTEDLVLDHLPEGAWLIDLGQHALRDLPRPERVRQLCHPDLLNDFPPLRAGNGAVAQHLPVQLTSFVGREGQIAEVRELLATNRLVTLTGAGGVGKTRMAVHVASMITGEFGHGTRYVDLAPITDPDVLPVAVARALGLPDQPGRSTVNTIVRSIGEHELLMVLDNCEHLLDSSAEMIQTMVGACPNVTLLATSREPIGLAGEVTWRVPSLSLTDEAVVLFADRARLARSEFALTEDSSALVTEICRRLDGVPLAIELAAARVRALSLQEINDSLHDRFRLLTGGSRTAVRRQQTLRASVDWSHALLSEPERVLFRRLAVFAGGFDLNAAQMVTGSSDVERYQVLDQLTLLVDKSLVVADSAHGQTRYRLLETVRQYAAEKLGESEESADIRARHRGYYTSLAAELDNPPAGQHEQLLAQAEVNIDNSRAAFAWSQDSGDTDAAMQLASALLPLWLARGRIMEGLSWFDAVLTDSVDAEGDVTPAVLARALADKALLDAWGITTDRMDQAEKALAIARQVGDPALVVRALTACGSIAAYEFEVAQPYLAEASALARELGDRWRLSQILCWQSYAAFWTGDPRAAYAAGVEGRDLADSINDRFSSRFCRAWGIVAQLITCGDLAGATRVCTELLEEADAASDVLCRYIAVQHLCIIATYRGEAATDYADALAEAGAELGGFFAGSGTMLSGWTELAAGNVSAAKRAHDLGWPIVSVHPVACAVFVSWRGEVALAAGELDEARRWADDAVVVTRGWHRATALATRSRVGIETGELEQAERDAYDGLAVVSEMEAHVITPEVLECLARVLVLTDRHREAARIFGATESLWQRTGAARSRVHQEGVEKCIATARDALGDSDFKATWAEGAALSTEEAIAYAQRGRGARKRPSSGWASLTPTELDVVRLVSEGLANKDIAARLFISPRTVQTHLTHVYTKLGLTSRVQLAQEAARRS